MGRPGLRLRMGLAIAVVAGLLLGSIAASWRAAGEALGRDRRRAEGLRMLAKADDALAVRGAQGLSYVPDWPEILEPDEWATLDAWLAVEATRALEPFPGVEGGYFVPSAGDRYLGHASSKPPTRTGRRTAPLPALEIDLIDEQVRRAWDGGRAVDRLIEMPPIALAIRASPLKVNGRRVAATWAAIRLDDTDALARSLRGYQWASGLALGGLVLALALAFGLLRTIRRQNAEKSRMETEYRRNERLASLGKLLAGVSHELRNPLAGIRSAAQLWQRGIVSDDDLAAELIGEVDRLDGIIAQMLQFSRAEPRALEPGDLNALAAEAARLAGPAAEAQGVRIDLDLAPGLPPVAMDAPALLRTLRNLTTNGLQFQPDGGVLAISTRIGPRGDRAEIRVADHGPGIAPEARAHLFEPFFSTRPEGTGLGLAIAREIALAHGGDLRVDEDAERGAGFVLTLPTP